MDLKRRGFLIGMGGLITSAFVGRAKAHIRARRGPLLVAPAKAEETLFAYPPIPEMGNGWILTLGPFEYEPSYTITWREFFRRQGRDMTKLSDFRYIRQEWRLTAHDLDRPMNERTWLMMWDLRWSPCARAFRLLQELEIGPWLERHGAGPGELDFIEYGYHPCSSDQWVEARNQLTISLLQARFVELNVPIRVEVGQWD
ncbi:hypothetical protein [Benzoatithermus flavus]|uniref:Uncharacterized protein n=1 Tax=Benzoatithermus flavus TaxID=3108223 RepID=A0ABU8XQP9_9PROT